MEMTKSDLEKYNLYFLRKLAKEKGVKSPTSLKKSELIENILDIENGEKQPFFTNIGRPSLKSSEIENVENRNKKLTDKLIKELEKSLYYCDKLREELNKVLLSYKN